MHTCRHQSYVSSAQPLPRVTQRPYNGSLPTFPNCYYFRTYNQVSDYYNNIGNEDKFARIVATFYRFIATSLKDQRTPTQTILKMVERIRKSDPISSIMDAYQDNKLLSFFTQCAIDMKLTHLLNVFYLIGNDFNLFSDDSPILSVYTREKLSDALKRFSTVQAEVTGQMNIQSVVEKVKNELREYF